MDHRPPSLLRQCAIAIASMAMLLLVVSSIHNPRKLAAQLTVDAPTRISVDHTSPTALQVTIGTRGAMSLVELRNSGESGVMVSLPASWTLQEVKQTTIASLGRVEIAGSLTRWNVATGASLVLTAPEPLARLTVLNPSALPLHISYRRTDLTTGSTQERDALLSDRPITFPS